MLEHSCMYILYKTGMAEKHWKVEEEVKKKIDKYWYSLKITF